MVKTGIHLLLWVVLFGAVSHCADKGIDLNSVRQQWQKAVEMWQKRDVNAFRAWMSIDPNSDEGREARRLIEAADQRYQKGIALFAAKKMEAAGRAFDEGARVAPIHPKHYLTLAKMYEAEHMQERAAKYYAKFAQALPEAKEAEAARAAAGKVDPGFEGVFDPPAPSNAENRTAESVVPAAAFFAAALGLLSAFLLLRQRFGPGVSLSRLIDQAPELHSAIAYLIGSLRHELLKHRIGVAADVIKGLESGKTTGPQQIFLGERLFQGVPLDEAWRAHLAAFTRVLGPRFNPSRDRFFCKAGHAILRIAALKNPLFSRSLSAIRTLSDARRTLMLFDSRLAFLQSRLVRTRVDKNLFEQIVAEVQGEYAALAVPLDDLHIEEVEQEVFIEVPRGDLVLILKNILRNAIMAVGKNAEDRRVGMGLRISLEPTGQEIVRLCVWDSSPFIPSEETIQHSGPDSGLGLVMLAVKRYGGTLEIKPTSGPYKKEATIRFFCALEDSEEPGGDP